MDIHPLRFLQNLSRSREIARVLLNHGFGDLLDRMQLRRYLQWGKRLFTRRASPDPQPTVTRAERVRLVLEELGPTFVKFGQVMSTRPDLVPDDVIDELTKLQERVPPFPAEAARRAVESELGKPVKELFSKFEDQPLAAGSLGQVHVAHMKNGKKVAVKIRRPNVVRDVERDLGLLQELASLLVRHVPESEVFDPVGLVNHFSRTIRRELNFLRECRTIEEFAKLFRNDATLTVPHVEPELTTEAVLTMEFIEGCRIQDTEALQAAGVSARDVAANGARIFMKQAFELGFFHGDPHPGNIRVMPDGSICLLDYGMVGMLDDEKRDRLVDLFSAVVREDARSATDVVLRLGEPIRPVDELVLRADVRDFVQTYYGIPLEHLDVGKMLTDFVGILSNHAIRCPGDLMLLIRAIVTLEGVGRELDPEFNLAKQLAPFVEKIVRERYNPRRLAARLYEEIGTFAQLAHDMPLHIGKTLEKLSQDDLKVQLEHRGIDHLITEIDRSSNRLVIGLVLAALIVASALIIRSGANVVWFSIPVFLLSSLLGVWLIYGIFRSGRL